MCYIYSQQSETNMLIAIHRRLYRWYHERRIRRLRSTIAFIERDLETSNLGEEEMFAVECWLDQTVNDLRFHQDKLAALFPQPTNER